MTFEKLQNENNKQANTMSKYFLKYRIDFDWLLFDAYADDTAHAFEQLIDFVRCENITRIEIELLKIK